jgi:hypothetical protein
MFYNTLYNSLQVILYVCETWSLARRKKQNVGAWEHSVEKKIFEPKKE